MSLDSVLSLSVKQGQPTAWGTCVETHLPGKQQRKITTVPFDGDARLSLRKEEKKGPIIVA